MKQLWSKACTFSEDTKSCDSHSSNLTNDIKLRDNSILELLLSVDEVSHFPEFNDDDEKHAWKLTSHLSWFINTQFKLFPFRKILSLIKTRIIRRTLDVGGLYTLSAVFFFFIFFVLMSRSEADGEFRKKTCFLQVSSQENVPVSRHDLFIQECFYSNSVT